MRRRVSGSRSLSKWSGTTLSPLRDDGRTRGLPPPQQRNSSRSILLWLSDVSSCLLRYWVSCRCLTLPISIASKRACNLRAQQHAKSRGHCMWHSAMTKKQRIHRRGHQSELFDCRRGLGSSCRERRFAKLRVPIVSQLKFLGHCFF
jgi:hypothetical protein